MTAYIPRAPADFPGKRAASQHQGNAPLSGIAPGRKVKFFFPLPHFQHVAQNTDLASGQRRQGVDSAGDGVWVRVIAVVNKGQIAGFQHRAPAANRLVCGHAPGDFFIAESHQYAHSDPRQSGVDHVPPESRNRQRYAPFSADGPAAGKKSLRPDFLRPQVAAFGQAEAELLLAAFQRPQPNIIPVHNGDGVLGHIVQHLGLCLQHPVLIVKKFQMGVAYDGKHSHGGPGYLGKTAHLPKVRNPHLYHGGLMLRRNAGDCHGHTYLIIQVFIRFQHGEAA